MKKILVSCLATILLTALFSMTAFASNNNYTTTYKCDPKTVNGLDGDQSEIEEGWSEADVDNPETGDHNSIVVWIVICALALIAIVIAIIMVFRKKK